MKAHPRTGKSTLAIAIAKKLKCPLIDNDHFRDCTHTIQQALAAENHTCTAAKLLNELSYEAMWRVTGTKLELGLSVVIDSPLSKHAHLDRLLEMASKYSGRAVVVECRPGNALQWRRRVEERVAHVSSAWHKPSTWNEIETLLDGYGGCWDSALIFYLPQKLDKTGRASYLSHLELLSVIYMFSSRVSAEMI